MPFTIIPDFFENYNKKFIFFPCRKKTWKAKMENSGKIILFLHKKSTLLHDLLFWQAKRDILALRNGGADNRMVDCWKQQMRLPAGKRLPGSRRILADCRLRKKRECRFWGDKPVWFSEGHGTGGVKPFRNNSPEGRVPSGNPCSEGIGMSSCLSRFLQSFF